MRNITFRLQRDEKSDKSVTVCFCAGISGFAIANQIQVIAEGSHYLEHEYLCEHDARTEDGKWPNALKYGNAQQADVHDNGDTQCERVDSSQKTSVVRCTFNQCLARFHFARLTRVSCIGHGILSSRQ